MEFFRKKSDSQTFVNLKFCNERNGDDDGDMKSVHPMSLPHIHALMNRNMQY